MRIISVELYARIGNLGRVVACFVDFELFRKLLTQIHFIRFSFQNDFAQTGVKVIRF